MEQPNLLQKLRASELNLRVFAHMRGCTPPYEPEAAATYFREALDLPKSSFRRRAALSYLPTHYSLLDEVNAVIPACFEIQALAIELAESEPNAYGAAMHMLEKTPTAIMVRSILGKACETGATGVRMRFGAETSGVEFEYSDGWQEVGSAGNDWEIQLRDFLFRLEKLGYARLRPYMDVPDRQLPREMKCYWESDACFRMDIQPDRGAVQYP